LTPKELDAAGESLFTDLQWSTSNPFADALGVHWRTLLKWRRGEHKIPAIAETFIKHMLECIDYKA